MALPRLLYLGDVGVESSYHGSALLFRLLHDYPPKQLMILEAGPWHSQERRRLPAVSYRSFPIGWGRLLNSRFSRQYGSMVLALMSRKWRQVQTMVQAFKPEAVLTVVHGYSWIAAAEFAFRSKLPLHLILHDDWLTGLQVLTTSKRAAEKMLAKYYRYSMSRLCVSPAMAEQYEKRFGVPGEVLYPIRAADSPGPFAAVDPVDRGSPLTVAYAGTINGGGYIERLISMAEALEELAGKLIIYGPISLERAKQIGLSRPNVLLAGLVSSSELIERLRVEADILFLPMSFRTQDRTNMELSFPSKLTDYTTVGIPILINGPPYCSAVRWAQENPGVAEVVEGNDRASLLAALGRLKSDPIRRHRLAEVALKTGAESFSHAKLSRCFIEAIARGCRE